MSSLALNVHGLNGAALARVLDPVLVAHGVALTDISFQREQSGWVLRLAIERPGSTDLGGGVTLDLCADVSRDLSHALDVEDIVPHAYTLEVASPGVERPLKTLEAFSRFVGKAAKVQLTRPAPDGQRVLRGTIRGVSDEVITMTVDGNEVVFPFADAKEAHLVFEFGASAKPPRGGKRQRAARTE